MLRIFGISVRWILTGGFALLVVVEPWGADAKSTETVLYSFTSGEDGGYPLAGLIADAAGNFYGTTYEAGKYNGGTVFKFAPDGTETVLYSFCAKNQNGCIDGNGPQAPVTMDNAGNLYGTTTFGGKKNRGLVFKLAPNGKETVLHAFCSESGCSDGASPSGGVVVDNAGHVFGTTEDGGYENCVPGCGTVFRLAPNGKETVLYSFCPKPGCADGESPASTLIADAAGNLYGTTVYGGKYGGGTVFKLAPNGTERVLYSFCAKKDCSDGAEPIAGLKSDGAGNFYGTTYIGGKNNGGTVFKLAAG